MQVEDIRYVCDGRYAGPVEARGSGPVSPSGMGGGVRKEVWGMNDGME